MLINFAIESPKLVIEPSIYDTPLDVVYSGLPPNSDMKTIMDKFDNSGNWKSELKDTNVITEWDQYNFEKRSIDRKGAYWFTKLTSANHQYEYVA